MRRRPSKPRRSRPCVFLFILLSLVSYAFVLRSLDPFTAGQKLGIDVAPHLAFSSPPSSSLTFSPTAPLTSAYLSAYLSGEQSPEPDVVYCCGYGEKSLAQHLFPSSTVTKFTRKAAESYAKRVRQSPSKANEVNDEVNQVNQVNRASVMLADWPLSRCSNYTGRVLSLNGESHLALGSIFPGAVHLGVGGVLPYVSWAATSYASPATLPWVADRLKSNYGEGIYPDAFLGYKSSNCVPHRESAFVALSAIGVVTAEGSCTGTSWYNIFSYLFPNRNIIHSPEELREGKRTHWSTSPLVPSYRFVLCMENKNVPGYVTEKILSAFLSGSIPVYYGSYDVFSIFNQDRFIYYDVDHPGDALRRIKELEEDVEAYGRFKRQPILAEGDETLKKFFSWSEEVGDGVLKEKVRALMGVG
jgi:hypothetical protein